MRSLHKILGLIAFFIILSTTLTAQSNYGRRSYLRNNPLKEYPGVGISGGIIHFQGDYGSYSVGVPQYGGSIFLDHQFNGTLGIRVNLSYVAIAEKFNEPYDGGNELYPDLELTSTLYGGDLDLLIYFNDLLGFDPKRNPFSPYISFGVGAFMFDSKNVASGKDLNYDNSYEEMAINVPFGAGLKVQLGGNFEFFLGTKFYYTTTDYIDGWLGYNIDTKERSDFNHSNDTYLYSHLGLIYNFGTSKKRGHRRVRAIPSYRW